MSTTSALLLGTQLLGVMKSSSIIDVPIIAASTVPATQLILLDGAHFASGECDAPSIDASKEVTLHEEDTVPLPLASGVTGAAVVAAPERSMFQTACIALRLHDAEKPALETGDVAKCDVAVAKLDRLSRDR